MKRTPARRLRSYTVLAVIVLVLSGSLTHFGFGTLSSFGEGIVSLVCPLGYLEAMLAKRAFVPKMLVGLGVTIAAILLLGRIFCAWICPIPSVRRWISPKAAAAQKEESDPPPDGSAPASTATTGYFVLGGALLSSALFGFPVFCLVCPIGLFFGTLVALMRLLRFNEPTLTLLVFPVVLIVEIIVLRKWCSRICPLGALIGLLSRLNRTFRPKVDSTTCLSAKGESKCTACKQVCPEGIDPRDAGARTASCTKCLDCADGCPVKAIRFPWSRT